MVAPIVNCSVLVLPAVYFNLKPCMKKILLTLAIVFLITQLRAQNFEVSIQANTGLFHYGGSSATAVSFIQEAYTDKLDYTNNPYGSKNGFSYGLDVQAQHVSKSGFIIGLQAGYDILRSKENINDYDPLTFILYTGANWTGDYQIQIPVKGQTVLQNQDINVNPYIGYRIQTKKIKIDVLPGIDLGFNINSYDKGKGTDSEGNVYRTDLELTNAPTDVRFRLGVAAWYGRFGITAAFSYGLTNLDKSNIGNDPYNAHSELLRFGITYRLF